MQWLVVLRISSSKIKFFSPEISLWFVLHLGGPYYSMLHCNGAAIWSIFHLFLISYRPSYIKNWIIFQLWYIFSLFHVPELNQNCGASRKSSNHTYAGVLKLGDGPVYLDPNFMLCVSWGLLHKCTHEFCLQLWHIKTLLQCILGQNDVIVNPSTVQCHRDEQLAGLQQKYAYCRNQTPIA